jgi:RHS repeat-associated protein
MTRDRKSSGLWAGFSRQRLDSQRKRRLRRRQQRAMGMERLEDRRVLNAAPMADPDSSYFTYENSALTIGSSDITLLDNDWDAEGSSLTASIVDNPANGTITNFSSTVGTFTYTPDTSFSGIDTFTYRVNDGTDNSNVAQVSIAVGGDLGPRTNQDEIPLQGNLLDGKLAVSTALTPGLNLVYNSNTLPQPIIVVETFLEENSYGVDDITAKLTFDGTAGTEYSYDAMSLSGGDTLRFALQADATSLSTGRYDYSVLVTTDTMGTEVEHTFDGSQNIVNRGSSTSAYGRGWQLAGLDSLAVDTDGVLWVQSDGNSLWYAEDGSGGFDAAEGTSSTLVENVGGTYTLTSQHGIELNFDSSGNLTSREDRNGNSVDYTYTSGLLTKITDAVGRDTTLTYTSGRLTSVADFASRTATLTYDASGRLSGVTQPDPDGAGALASPVTDFAYDATSHALTKVTDPLDKETAFTYGSHGRLTNIKHPGNQNWQLTSLQTVGLPTGASGNTLASADPQAIVTNERSKVSKFRLDRFGGVLESVDALNRKTTYLRDSAGQLAKITGADPDGSSNPLTKPVSIIGYDDSGNVVYTQDALGNTTTATFTSSFNQLASATDALGNTTTNTYDTAGNLTKITDANSNEWTFEYSTSGDVTKSTTPDPDGAGSLLALSTTYAYDTYRRLTTTTHPDTETVVNAYDSADNITSVTDELGNAATFVFDALNRLTSVTDREGGETTHEYDARGSVISTTNALGDETTFEYNGRGWLTTETRPDPDGAGPLSAPVVDYTYDATGNVTQTGEPNYINTEGVWFEYDAVGNKTLEVRGAVGVDETSFEYDNLNRLTSVTDSEDSETRYTYDAVGRLTAEMRVIDLLSNPVLGVTTTYAYDANGNQTDVTDPRGYVTVTEYDAVGNVVSVTLPDPDGAGFLWAPYTEYEYDAIGRLVSEYDLLFSRTTAYEYDGRNRPTKITLPDPDGTGSATAPVTEIEYDAAGRQTKVTDPLDRETTYTYDKEGRVKTVTAPDPDGTGPLTAPVASTNYNALGMVTSTTDALGGVTSYEYDDAQRITKVTQPDPDGTGPASAPSIVYVYNGQGLLDTVTDPMGRDTVITYDSKGRRTKVADDAGNETTYAYNTLGQATSVTGEDPDGAGPQAAPVTTYTYDTLQRNTQITDAENGKTYFTYDDAGNVLTLKDPVNNVTSYAYDGLGRVTMENNELGDARSYYYDVVGRITKQVDRNERIRQSDYDELDRMVKEEWFSSGTPLPTLTITTTTDGGPASEVQRVGFEDDMGSLYGTFSITFDGQTTSDIDYDASAASVTSVLEALSNVGVGEIVVTKTIDDMGEQEWKLTYGGSLGGTNVAQATVDTSNLWVMGTITETEVTDIQGSGSGADEVQTVTLANANGGTFRLAFDGQTTSPLDHDATNSELESALEALAAVNNVTVTGTAGSWTVTFGGTQSGENLNRMNGDTARVTSGTEENEVLLTYDAAGQLLTAADTYSSYEYTYNDLGRVLTVDNDGTSGVPNVILTSAFDAMGNRTSLAAEIDGTDDFLNTYTYDALHRLTELNQDGQTGGNTVAEKLVNFSYNSSGQYTEIARFNDLDGLTADEVATSTYGYDSLSRLTDLEYENAGVDLFTPYEWTFDSLNRITQFVSQDGTTDYDYDKTGQLTDADHSSQTDEAYSYDANGNRTMTGYTTGDNNQLTNDGAHSYEYDDEGNRTKRTHDTTDEVTEYQWDFRNRLVKVTDKDDMGTITQAVEYTYDVFNRRIEKAVDVTSPFTLFDAEIERYVYDDINGVTSIDGGNIVLDFVDSDGDGAGSINFEGRYLYSNTVDEILAQENMDETSTSAGRVFWFLADILGTVHDLIGNDGEPREHYTYDSFGSVVSGDTSLTRYLFTSREYDADTGLQYNRARWYDSETGRWVSEDPIGFAGGDANISRYAANNVTGTVDPSGLIPPGWERPLPGERGRPKEIWNPPLAKPKPVPTRTFMLDTGLAEARIRYGIVRPPKFRKWAPPSYSDYNGLPVQIYLPGAHGYVQIARWTELVDGKRVAGDSPGWELALQVDGGWMVDVSENSGMHPDYRYDGHSGFLENYRDPKFPPSTGKYVEDWPRIPIAVGSIAGERFDAITIPYLLNVDTDTNFLDAITAIRWGFEYNDQYKGIKTFNPVLLRELPPYVHEAYAKFIEVRYPDKYKDDAPSLEWVPR